MGDLAADDEIEARLRAAADAGGESLRETTLALAAELCEQGDATGEQAAALVLYDAAERAALTALEHLPDCPTLLAAAAKARFRAVYRLTSKAEKRVALTAADEYLEHALILAPDEPAVLYCCGVRQKIAGEMEPAQRGKVQAYAEAEAYYRRVLELQPSCLDALGDLGYVIKKLGDSDPSLEARLQAYCRAEDCYRRVLEVEPNHISTLVDLAVLVKNRGELQPSRAARIKAYLESEAIYQHVLRMQPSRVIAINNYALLLKNRGDIEPFRPIKYEFFAQSELFFRSVLKLHPDRISALSNLALLIKNRADGQPSIEDRLTAYTEVEIYYRRILKLQEDGTVVRNNLGVLLADRGHVVSRREDKLKAYHEAASLYRQRLMEHPDHIKTLANLGSLEFAMSQVEQDVARDRHLANATSFLARVLDFQPTNMKAMRYLLRAGLEVVLSNDGRASWPTRARHATVLLARRRAFAAVTRDPYFRTELSSAAWPLGPLGAVCHVRAGDLPGAVAHLDANMAMSLAEALATPERRLVELEQAGDHAAARAFVAARGALNLRRQERVELLQAPKGDNEEAEAARLAAIAELGREISELEQQFDAAIDDIRKIEGFADFLRPGGDIDLIHAAAKERPLVYLCASPWGGHALVVHGESIDDVPLPDLKDEAVAERLEGWRAGYQDLREAFATSDARRAEARFLPAPAGACPPVPAEDPRHEAALAAFDAATRELCRWLGEAAMAPLVTRLEALGARRAVLLPSGRLTWLPLHAAIVGGSDARPLLALERLELSYAANARLARDSAARLARPAATPPAAAAIVDPAYAKPEHRHTYGPAEVAMLEQHAREGRLQLTCHAGPRARVVLGETVEPDAFAVADLATQQLLHLGCHAHTAHGEIFASSLQLAAGADGVDQSVTVETVLDHWPVEGLRLVVLSCCEGAMAAEQSFDELISLQTAFAQAGAASVVGAMWAVRDDHTAAIMQHFYDALLADPALDPAKALATAQVRLLDATPDAFPTIAAFQVLQG